MVGTVSVASIHTVTILLRVYVVNTVGISQVLSRDLHSSS